MNNIKNKIIKILGGYTSSEYKKETSILNINLDKAMKQVAELTNYKAKKEAPIDLSQFESTSKRAVNGRYVYLPELLNDEKQEKIVYDWVDNNLGLDFTNNSLVEISKDIREAIGLFDKWRYEDKEYWFTPEEFIKNKLEGNCNDMFEFLYYVYMVIFKNMNQWDSGYCMKNRLYCATMSVNNNKAQGIGHHGTLLVKLNDDKFYVIESYVKKNSDYILDSLKKFGKYDVMHNDRYGNSIIAEMWNCEKYYKKVCLVK